MNVLNFPCSILIYFSENFKKKTTGDTVILCGKLKIIYLTMKILVTGVTAVGLLLVGFVSVTEV